MADEAKQSTIEVIEEAKACMKTMVELMEKIALLPEADQDVFDEELEKFADLLQPRVDALENDRG